MIDRHVNLILSTLINIDINPFSFIEKKHVCFAYYSTYLNLYSLVQALTSNRYLSRQSRRLTSGYVHISHPHSSHLFCFFPLSFFFFLLLFLFLFLPSILSPSLALSLSLLEEEEEDDEEEEESLSFFLF